MNNPHIPNKFRIKSFTLDGDSHLLIRIESKRTEAVKAGQYFILTPVNGKR
jgi:hypothetical protein